MQNKIPEKLTNAELEAFTTILGSAPILSTEIGECYNIMWENLIQCFKPRDFMELLLIRQVQDETWKIMRYTRHQAVAVERRFRQSLEFQAARTKEDKARKEKAARDLAEKKGGPVPNFEKLERLEEVVWTTVTDGDDILLRKPKEFDHNRALEEGIVFEEQLDRLINSAHRRRNDALQQLETYRDGLGQYWRRISDKIIEGSATEITEPPKQIDSPPLAPSAPDQQRA